MAAAVGAQAQEQIVHLRVSWATYEALASGIGEDSRTLLVYDGKILELMSPTTDHEAYAKLIDALLTMVVTEWNANLYNTGSATLKAEPVGAEPDTSYYAQNAERVDGLAKIDFRTSPPPDLVVEVDLSHRRMDKLELYSKLGVPEFWRFGREGLQGFALVEGANRQIEVSGVVNGLPLAQVATFLERRLESDRRAVYRDWQSWLRENRHLHRSD
jgi:Uma2 family endonuclease